MRTLDKLTFNTHEEIDQLYKVVREAGYVVLFCDSSGVDLFWRRDRSDISSRLLLAGSNDSRPALVTPPDQNIGAWRNPANINLHTRPRLELIDTLKVAPAPRAHGGLSARALRRVREYVQVHLRDLSMLAGDAGLSMQHFVREFKQSADVTPHHYLIQKRTERAQQMLVQTDLALAEIAYAVGFSDHGHLLIFVDCSGPRLDRFGGCNVGKQRGFEGLASNGARSLNAYDLSRTAGVLPRNAKLERRLHSAGCSLRKR